MLSNRGGPSSRRFIVAAAIVLTAVLVLVAPAALAAPITIAFQGVVTANPSEGHDTFPGVSVGEAYHASFWYDPDYVDANHSANVSVFHFPITHGGWSLWVGSYFASGDFVSPGNIGRRDDHDLGGIHDDQWAIGCDEVGCGFVLTQLGPAGIFSYPSAVPAASDWALDGWTTTEFSYSVVTGTGTSGPIWAGFEGSVTSMTAVPEPATMGLLLLGLGIGRTLRRRRR